ncbi:hypothetical protein [Nitratireductor sp. GCM10026969]|uniref:hypothetical protein n=1 Tax=Nitratireductor sp. GCM10026969 TaxID=3252645 RepID=UPI0036137794
MYTQNRTLFTAFFIVLAGITTAGAQMTSEMNKTLDAFFGEHAQYQKFFKDLKKAVAADDKQTAASLVGYLLTARINGKAASIRDAAHLANCEKVFTAKVKKAAGKQTCPSRLPTGRAS